MICGHPPAAPRPGAWTGQGSTAGAEGGGGRAQQPGCKRPGAHLYCRALVHVLVLLQALGVCRHVDDVALGKEEKGRESRCFREGRTDSCQVTTPGLSDNRVLVCPREDNWAQECLFPLTCPLHPGSGPPSQSLTCMEERCPRPSPVMPTWLSWRGMEESSACSSVRTAEGRL